MEENSHTDELRESNELKKPPFFWVGRVMGINLCVFGVFMLFALVAGEEPAVQAVIIYFFGAMLMNFIAFVCFLVVYFKHKHQHFLTMSLSCFVAMIVMPLIGFFGCLGIFEGAL